MKIREANLNDAESITSLSEELGYKPTLEQIKNKIIKFSSNDNEKIYVAELENKVVGWMHISFVEPLESEAFVELRGIVVNKSYRKQGIGSQLINMAEKWARKKECNKIRIRTNIKRTETIEYYSNLGFESIKSQQVFEKI